MSESKNSMNFFNSFDPEALSNAYASFEAASWTADHVHRGSGRRFISAFQISPNNSPLYVRGAVKFVPDEERSAPATIGPVHADCAAINIFRVGFDLELPGKGAIWLYNHVSHAGKIIGQRTCVGDVVAPDPQLT